MNTRKLIKLNNNLTMKKRNKKILNVQSINDFDKNIYINKNNFKEDFLSSCFKYYYGNIQICDNKINQSCKKIKLTKSFLNITSKGALVIIDYPNVIHILYEHYKDKNKVVEYFYNFIYKQLEEKTKFYIISKEVIIDNIHFDIKTVFNEGYKLSGKLIKKHYFDNEDINIYDLNYKIKISSSIDDLLGYFICFILFVYLSKSGINVNQIQHKSSFFSLKKLNIITNDRQFFNKNLFGLTEDETKNHIEIIKDLKVNKLTMNNSKYTFDYNNLDKQLISHFLNEYVITNSKDTKNLECKIIILFEIFNNSLNKSIKTNKFDFFTYNKINSIQQKYLNKYYNKCKGLKNITTKDNNLIQYYYLYFFIKYVQLYLHANKKNGINYGDFYGSHPKEKIIELFLNE